MSAAKKVPAIRFKGVSGDWGFRTFDELIDEQILFPPKDGNHGSIHPKSTDFVDYGIPFIMANNVKMGKIDIYNCSHIKKEQADNLQKGFANEGDVLLTHKGTVGEVAIVHKNEFPYLMLTPQVTYYRISKIELLDNKFLAASFVTSRFQRVLRAVSGGGTRAYVGITAQQKLGISIPPLAKEQTQIGNYFQQLDSLIAQHQQMHDKLLSLKKSLLEKMFPNQGEKVPEIRFNGFSGEWAEKNLNDVSIVSTGFPFDSDDFDSQGEYLVITNGNIQDDLSIVDASVGNKINIDKNSKLYEYVLNTGDILVTMDGTVGRVAKVLDEKQILAQRVGRLTAKFDYEFLYQLLCRLDFFKTMTLISHGGTIKHISLSEIACYKSYFPMSVDEQIKIGQLFKQLDTLLNQHQAQLNKLSNIKQACLEKMFI